MAYYLTRPCAIQPNKVMYYSGNGKWSDNSALKQTYDTKAEVDTMIDNTDYLNGGFKNATVVEE